LEYENQEGIGSKREKESKRTSSSSITQGSVSRLPKLIAPRIGTETLNPLFPKFTYSALLLSNPAVNAFEGVAILSD
jgi:hypothetical protein